VFVDSGDGGAAGTRDKILNSDYSAGGIGTDMKYAKTNFRPSISTTCITANVAGRCEKDRPAAL